MASSSIEYPYERNESFPEKDPHMLEGCTLYEAMALLAGIPEAVATRYGAKGEKGGDKSGGRGRYDKDMMYPTMLEPVVLAAIVGSTSSQSPETNTDFDTSFRCFWEIGKARLEEATLHDKTPAYGTTGRVDSSYWITRKIDCFAARRLRWRRHDLEQLLCWQKVWPSTTRLGSDVSQRSLHKRAWTRWKERRLADNRWVPLLGIADRLSRKPATQGDRQAAENDAWRRIYNSVAHHEFCRSGTSRVLLVHAGHTCWWMDREKLVGALPGDEVFKTRAYLSRCWIPADVASEWLATFGINTLEVPLTTGPTHDNSPPHKAQAWMNANTQPQTNGKRYTRGEAIKACRIETGCTESVARAVWNALPPSRKNPRGAPKRLAK